MVGILIFKTLVTQRQQQVPWKATEFKDGPRQQVLPTEREGKEGVHIHGIVAGRFW